jgi:hypothetical protein
MKQPHFLFLHIPKCAGTALVRLIEANYPEPNRIPLYQGTHLGDDFKPWFERGTGRAFYGHFYWQDSFVRPDVYRFVVLRRPMERELSNYLFLRQSPDPAHRAWRREWRHFGDYLRAKQALNHQVRMLSGMGRFAYFQAHQEEAFEAAKDHIRRFSRIGFAESLPESMAGLAQDMRWPSSSIKRHNVGSRKWQVPFLKWRYRRALEEVTRLDQALYDYAWRLQRERDYKALGSLSR